ncbi:MAG: hypothetical protein IKR43_01875 [Lachnospiraceae bacterium]|nr:hypothetical protein [Lachnospiraceae bacterium]
MNHSRHFRLAALILALSLMLSACGSATPSSTEAPETTLPASTEATQPITTTEEPTTEYPTTEEPREPLTIEEYTLIDKDKVTAVIRDFAEDEEGARINLSLKNGTDKNIAVCCTSLVLNGYTMTEPAGIRLEPGAETEDALFFDRAVLDELGIAEIGSVIADYKVIDTDTGETLIDADAYEIKTSAYERMTDGKVWEGRELYRGNDVLILLTDVTATRTGGTCFKLYVENASKKNIALVGLQALVNGRLADAPYLGVVNAGGKALTDLIVTKTVKDKYGIGDETDSLEFSLEARDCSSWDLLFTTGSMFADISGNEPVLSDEAEADTEFVAEKQLLDDDDLTLSCLGWIPAAEHGPGLKLQITNKSDKDIRFRVDAVIADDYLMNNCGLIVTVTAGGTADAALYLDQDVLNLTGNTEFGTIVLGCSLQDGETHEVLKALSAVTVETAAKERVTVADTAKGKTICNEKKLQIVAIAYTGYSETVGERLYLWVKNSSDKTMVLEPIYTKVNGSYMLGIGKLTVPAGKMTIGTYTVPARETARHGIAEFRSMIMNTLVYDTDGKLQFTTLFGGIEVK